MYRAPTPVTACPRCKRALEERRLAGEAILTCPTCGGVWLDTEQTETVFKRRAGERRIVEATETLAQLSRAQRPPTDGPATCPQCSVELVACEAEGVRIDQCPAHGTWFDAHELRRIVEAADEPTVVETAVERSTRWLSRVLAGDPKLPR